MSVRVCECECACEGEEEEEKKKKMMMKETCVRSSGFGGYVRAHTCGLSFDQSSPTKNGSINARIKIGIYKELGKGL